MYIAFTVKFYRSKYISPVAIKSLIHDALAKYCLKGVKFSSLFGDNRNNIHVEATVLKMITSLPDLEETIRKYLKCDALSSIEIDIDSFRYETKEEAQEHYRRIVVRDM